MDSPKFPMDPSDSAHDGRDPSNPSVEFGVRSNPQTVPGVFHQP